MTTPHDDPERDRWLAQALRHAPDADAAPSPELSAAILRQARNAVKTPTAAARAAARPQPLSALWSWLARPPVAAGFASMMVAVLVGVMWWDRPIDETLPPRATTAPAAAAPQIEAQGPAPGGTPAQAQADAAAPAAPARPAPPMPTAKRERAATERAAPAETRQRNADVLSKQEAEREAPQPPAPAVPAASPSAWSSPAPAMAAAPAPAPAPPPLVAEQAARARDEAAESRAAGTLAKAAPGGAPNALRSQATTRASASGVPAERWSWRRDAEPRPMTRALQDWLAQLDRAARWRPASDTPPADATTLQLTHDGAPHSTIAIGADAVWLTPAQGTPLTAPLGAAAAAALKASLLAATP